MDWLIKIGTVATSLVLTVLGIFGVVQREPAASPIEPGNPTTFDERQYLPDTATSKLSCTATWMPITITSGIVLYLPTTYSVPPPPGDVHDWYIEPNGTTTSIYKNGYPGFIMDDNSGRAITEADLCSLCGGVYATSSDACKPSTNPPQSVWHQVTASGNWEWCATYDLSPDPDTGVQDVYISLRSKKDGHEYSIAYDESMGSEFIDPTLIMSQVR